MGASSVESTCRSNIYGTKLNLRLADGRVKVSSIPMPLTLRGGGDDEEQAPDAEDGGDADAAEGAETEEKADVADEDAPMDLNKALKQVDHRTVLVCAGIKELCASGRSFTTLGSMTVFQKGSRKSVRYLENEEI
jgi:hypothetical protein